MVSARPRRRQRRRRPCRPPGCGRARSRSRCEAPATGRPGPPRRRGRRGPGCESVTLALRAGRRRAPVRSRATRRRQVHLGRPSLQRGGLGPRQVIDVGRRPRRARPPRTGPLRGLRRSVGTTPSIIAWSWDSRTVAGVARSWAMSLAARRRSISDRSSRSAIALNASASSEDSRSSPPVARAARVAGLEASRGRRHVAQRPGEPGRDRRRRPARSRVR